MADLEQVVADPVEEVDSSDALEPTESQTDSLPESTQDDAPSDAGEPADEEEARPVSRRELAREKARLDAELARFKDDLRNEQQAKIEAEKRLAEFSKTQEQMAKDFADLVGDDEEFAQLDHDSRYAEDAFVREEALAKFTEKANIRKKLPTAWLWYVGQQAAGDMKAVAEESGFDLQAMMSFQKPKDLFKYIETESTTRVEKKYKGEIEKLQNALKAEKEAHDASRARAGGSAASPESGGRAAKGGGLTYEKWEAMSLAERLAMRADPDGRRQINDMTARMNSG